MMVFVGFAPCMSYKPSVWEWLMTEIVAKLFRNRLIEFKIVTCAQFKSKVLDILGCKLVISCLRHSGIPL